MYYKQKEMRKPIGSNTIFTVTFTEFSLSIFEVFHLISYEKLNIKFFKNMDVFGQIIFSKDK